MFNFETLREQMAKEVKVFLYKKYSSLYKPMCKRASCN